MNGETHNVKMTNWEVFARLVRDAKPIYGWLLLGALMGAAVVTCAVIAPQLLGAAIQLLYDAWAGERPLAGLTDALLPLCGGLAAVYLIKSALEAGKMYLMNNVVSRYYTCNLRISISDKISRLPISLSIRPLPGRSSTASRRMFPIWAAASMISWMCSSWALCRSSSLR